MKENSDKKTKAKSGWLSGFWNSATFAEKISILATSIGVVMMVFLIGFSSMAYKSDKESYLFELQALRARTASSQVSSAIDAAKASGALVARASELPSANAFALPRLPEKDEFFVYKEEKTHSKNPESPERYVLFRSTSGDLLRGTLRSLEARPEDSILYAITSEGKLLATNSPHLVAESKLSQRKAVAIALKSNLTEGTTSFEVGNEKFVVSYLEVPGTNVTVLAEVSLKKLMTPFWNALRLWLVFGIVIVLIGATLSFFAVNHMARPAKLAAECLVEIARGNFGARVVYEARDEFRVIFDGIDFLAKSIAGREKRLHLVGEGLKKILTETANLPVNLTPEELASHIAHVLNFILRPYNPTSFVVQNGEQTFAFSGQNPAKNAPAPTSAELAEGLDVPVTDSGGKRILLLVVLGVRPSQVWPETLQTLAQFSQSISGYFERKLSVQLVESEARRESEIALASSIQQCLVTFPEDVSRVEMVAHYEPAEKVGGDWMSAYYNPQEDVLRFFLGDATGHGVAPSLVTAAVAGATLHFQNSLQFDAQSSTANARLSGTENGEAHASKTTDMREQTRLQNFAVQLNKIVLRAGNNRIGMTMIMGSLRCKTGELTLINLGHPTPFSFSAARESGAKNPRLLTEANNPLGYEDFMPPKAITLNLTPGQGLMLYSDGLLENYPSPRRRRDLTKISERAQSAAEMLSLTKNYYDSAIVTGQKPDDDVAILALRWNG
jgi:serine phosphatase RsbU (regulator of sigma subunit)